MALNKALVFDIVALILTCNKKMHYIQAKSNVYYFCIESSIIVLALYVDDLLIIGSNQPYILHLKQALQDKYEMIDLGLLKKFLGVQFLQTNYGLLLHQINYALSTRLFTTT